MDPVSIRELVPRLILGLFIAAVAATGAFALSQFDGPAPQESSGGSATATEV